MCKRKSHFRHGQLPISCGFFLFLMKICLSNDDDNDHSNCFTHVDQLSL